MDTASLKEAIDKLVAIIEDAITVLKQFIAGFKKTVTFPVAADEEGE